MSFFLPFGSKEQWSTWTGIEIGGRLLSFLIPKVDHVHVIENDTNKRETMSPNISSMDDEDRDLLKFYNYSDPPINLEDYIKRLIFYTRQSVSPVNVAVAVLYIHRIEKNGKFEVNKYSIFRLLSVAYLVAFKYMDDPPVMKNGDYCKIAGLSLTELNALEVIFLKAIDYKLGGRKHILIYICMHIYYLI